MLSKLKGYAASTPSLLAIVRTKKPLFPTPSPSRDILNPYKTPLFLTPPIYILRRGTT